MMIVEWYSITQGLFCVNSKAQEQVEIFCYFSIPENLLLSYY